MSSSCTISVNNNKNFIDIQHSLSQPLSPSIVKRTHVRKKKPLSPPSPISLACNSITTATVTEIETRNDERVSLIEKLNENHRSILEARNEYLKEYKNFIRVAYKFYDEKYLNLKLKFKNQILKQQIYFESELYDISKECQRDYDYHVNKLRLECNNNNNSSGNSHLYKKFKMNIKNIAENYLKLCKIDMKKLIGYMRDALVNSYDTLIEAYETCHVLKLIEKLLKQNNMCHLELMNGNKNKFSSIQQYLNCSDETMHSLSSSSESASESTSSSDNDDENGENGAYIDEQMQILKYKQEMENLMNTLDDIEVQYLQRKDQMQKRSKLFYQLKSKIKYIQNKFDNLNKEVNNLKYESCVYQHLLEEKYISKKSIRIDEEQEQISFIKSELLPCESELSLLRKSNDDEDEDYVRKLHLISNLINLHKTKTSYRNCKQQLSSQNTQTNSLTNNKSVQTSSPTTLKLYECTCDGDLVTIENCNFKTDHDLSDWIITRQIDNMPSSNYKIPSGSICKSGKVLCVKTLFNDQLDFLYAIKKAIDSTRKNNISIRINTKLISPNGEIISLHTQEIPEFYREIFKCANLIGFF